MDGNILILSPSGDIVSDLVFSASGAKKQKPIGIW